jgi:predicted amidophosphoribosyltransferase
MTARRDNTPGVVARWAARRVADRPTICDECGEALDPGTTECPQCRQAAADTATGMLAVVVETAGGDRRLVVAERTPAGGWAPTRHLPATGQAVRALARQDATRGGAA